jgi:Tfp pilus assembly protein PilN
VNSVNLLPARYRPARPTGERAGIAYIALGVLAALLVMVLLVVVTNNKIDDANKKTAEAQAEQQAAEAKIGQLQAFGDFAALKASREAAVKGVAESRFDYERLMREIALVLPHDTYLTNLTSGAGAAPSTDTSTTATVTATGPSVTITACAPSHPRVAAALVRLRKLHNVTDVNLTNSTKAAAGSGGGTSVAGCKVTWGADLTFSPESPTTSTGPVPARLGGGQ